MLIAHLKKLLLLITLLFVTLGASVLPVSAKQDLVIDPLLFDINYTDRIILVSIFDINYTDRIILVSIVDIK